MLRPLAAPSSLMNEAAPRFPPRGFHSSEINRRCGPGRKRPFGVAQRTFSVARPIIARISEMIQKRITIVGSAQPFFS